VAGLKQTEETITLSKGRYLYVVGLICIMIQVHPLNLKESNGVSRFGLSNSTFQISVRKENYRSNVLVHTVVRDVHVFMFKVSFSK